MISISWSDPFTGFHSLWINLRDYEYLTRTRQLEYLSGSPVVPKRKGPLVSQGPQLVQSTARHEEGHGGGKGLLTAFNAERSRYAEWTEQDIHVNSDSIFGSYLAVSAEEADAETEGPRVCVCQARVSRVAEGLRSGPDPDVASQSGAGGNVQRRRAIRDHLIDRARGTGRPGEDAVVREGHAGQRCHRPRKERSFHAAATVAFGEGGHCDQPGYRESLRFGRPWTGSDLADRRPPGAAEGPAEGHCGMGAAAPADVDVKSAQSDPVSDPVSDPASDPWDRTREGLIGPKGQGDPKDPPQATIRGRAEMTIRGSCGKG